jgi:hypothetical protein
LSRSSSERWRFAASSQPVLGNHRLEAGQRLDPLEVLAEGAIEAVVEGFVLDQDGARQQVEIVEAGADQARLQRLEQRQQFLGRDRKLAGLEVQEEVDQH